MCKRKYLALLMKLKAEEIKQSAENPTAYMSLMHIKLHYVALRRKGF